MYNYSTQLEYKITFINRCYESQLEKQKNFYIDTPNASRLRIQIVLSSQINRSDLSSFHVHPSP